MIALYIRSSSVGNYHFCPRQYFISYVLGYKSEAKIRTDAGSIAHNILEVIAKRKKAKDEGLEFIEEPTIGKLSTKGGNFSEIIDSIYNYYTTGPFNNHNWTNEMYKHVKNCVWNAIKYENGKYSPHKKTIHAIEQEFDIEITDNWGTYSFKNGVTGETVTGQARIKGTIDLITKLDDKTLEIVDWKTGRRWAYDKEKPKEEEDLANDFQLLLYYYVACKLYPEYNVKLTIFYLKEGEGGPFTMPFNKNMIPEIEKRIQEEYQRILLDNRANKNYSYLRCNKFCEFSQKTLHQLNLSIPEETAKKKEFFTKKDNPLCVCDQVGKYIDDFGIDVARELLKNPSFELDKYSQPGGLGDKGQDNIIKEQL